MSLIQAANYFKYSTYHFEIVEKILRKFMENPKNFPKNSPINVMDIGCGSGRLLLEILNPMLPKNCSQLIGTDKNENMIKYCREIQNLPSHISFDILDITTKNLPEKFKEKFDLLFSSYCFMYVKDMRQALVNCNNMLKPDGHFFLTFLLNSPQEWTYRKMYEMNLWKQFTEEYANYESFFSNKNADGSEFKKMFVETNFDVVNFELNADHTANCTPEQVAELSFGMDVIYPNIPENDWEEYRRDFLKIFSKFHKINLLDQSIRKKKIKILLPHIFVHAKKRKF